MSALGLFIPEKTEQKGDLHVEGDVRIEGNFVGNLYCEDTLTIGKKAQITGEIECQNAHIMGFFSGTLRDNVAMGQDDCSDQHIIECLKMAGANFIGEGTSADLDFLIQDQGSNLSGGQRQSVMMARALVFSPDVFLFDEPTSAMDGVTEAEVIASLAAATKDKTLVVVTHKMPVVAMCDRVLVMDNGKLVGDGAKDAYFEMLQKHAEQKAK